MIHESDKELFKRFERERLAREEQALFELTGLPSWLQGSRRHEQAFRPVVSRLPAPPWLDQIHAVSGCELAGVATFAALIGFCTGYLLGIGGLF